MWEKKFSTENRESPLLLSLTFLIPEINEALKDSPTKFFGTAGQKIFDRKSWYPLLIHKLFRYLKFSETQHRRVPLWIFLALWDKIFSTENLDTPPPPFIHKHFFATGRFLKHRSEGFVHEFFSPLWDKKFLTESRDTPPLLSINFFATWNFLKHSTEGFPYEFFWHCETKYFRRKIVNPLFSYP